MITAPPLVFVVVIFCQMIAPIVMILYLPMMILLVFIIVVSSERVLKEQNQSKMLPSFILKKAIQKTTAQLRKHVATMNPTPFLKASRNRISVYIVSQMEKRN